MSTPVRPLSPTTQALLDGVIKNKPKIHCRSIKESRIMQHIQSPRSTKEHKQQHTTQPILLNPEEQALIA